MINSLSKHYTLIPMVCIVKVPHSLIPLKRLCLKNKSYSIFSFTKAALLSQTERFFIPNFLRNQGVHYLGTWIGRTSIRGVPRMCALRGRTALTSESQSRFPSLRSEQGLSAPCTALRLSQHPRRFWGEGPLPRSPRKKGRSGASRCKSLTAARSSGGLGVGQPTCSGVRSTPSQRRAATTEMNSLGPGRS